MGASFVDVHLYDNEIDRMIGAVRAQRQQQQQQRRQTSLQRKTLKGTEDAQRKSSSTRRGSSDSTTSLFTSTLERQRSLEEVRNSMRPVPKTPFLEAAAAAVSLRGAATLFASSPPLLGPLQPSGQQGAVSPHLFEGKAEIERLLCDLRTARNENALMRREMYGTLSAIGKLINQLRGVGGCGSPDGVQLRVAETGLASVGNYASLPTPTSVWELHQRGVLHLTPEEEEIARSINCTIETCKKRYEDMQKWYDGSDTPTVPNERKPKNDEVEEVQVRLRVQAGGGTNAVE